MGEGLHGPCFFCREDTADVCAVLPLLYEISETGSLGAYGMKHDVEDVLGRYVSTEELVRAGQVSFVKKAPGKEASFYTKSDDNGRTTGFYVRERFPLTWLWNKIKTKPRGAKKVHWDAYQAVLAEKTRRATPAVATEAGSHTPQSSPAHSSPADD